LLDILSVKAFAVWHTFMSEKDLKPLSLHEYLASVRAAKQMSLRDVEEATDNRVSNAYLSQLERGKITKPSPNVLHSLAKVYGVRYETLMEKAGYIMASDDRADTQRHGRVATFAKEHLTPEEEEELIRYLGYLRSIRGKQK
jgi:transcriptional regulator with XRE-family HTH domain